MSSERTGAIGASPLGAALGLGAALLTSLQGCAHVATPPGGPPDSIPPVLIAVQPDSYAVVTDFDDDVRFVFDETISERNTRTAVTLYPASGRPDVDQAGRELRVKPRDDWVANRIYHIYVEPVVQDLFSNRIPERLSYVFSTGLPIPENVATGIVFDRLTARPLMGGRLDLILLPDSLRYAAVADTAGRATVSALPPGTWLAIAYEDLNGNGRADEFDRADSLEVTLNASDTLVAEFQVFKHDTIGPRLTTATPLDSLVVEVGFDGYLDPERGVDTTNISLVSLPDSTPVPLQAVLHGWQYNAWRDSVRAVERARADSIAAAEAAAEAAADTLAGQAAPDTAGIPPPEAAAPEEVEQEGEPQEGEPQEGVDEEESEEPEQLPDRRLYVIAQVPIPPDSISVRARGIVNLTGLVGGGETIYQQPAPEPPPEEEPPPEQEPPPDEEPPARGAPLPADGETARRLSRGRLR